jgi:antitoxin component YwqK of YwqJK toxin-antitoxin module
MIKKHICFLTLFFLSSQAFSQTVGTYNYKGKPYLVFPYRIGTPEEIPMLGHKLPDGEYLAFTVYNFKENFSFRREKPRHLTDTTVVAAIFSIRNNMAEGRAVFYQYHYTKKGTESKKAFLQSEGMLTHNLKTGIWSGSIPGKSATEFTTYKNGLKHGYHSTYDTKGQIEMKEKFCEGEVCDTVCFFVNGKPDLAYDRPVNTPARDESCYGRGMELLNVVPEVVNTFYTIYDKTGPIYEFKYKDGTVLPYDSIGIEYEDGINYVTIKDEGKGKKRLHFVSDHLSEKIVDEYYYDTRLYRTIHLNETYKVRTTLFHRKKRGQLRYSYRKEEEYADPSTIDYNSLVPVLAEKTEELHSKTERYYIPKYHFAFVTNATSSLASIDTSRKIVFLNKQSFHGSGNPYHIRYEVACIPQEQQNLLVFQLHPYLKKGFIVCDERPDFIERYSRYDTELHDLETDRYYVFNSKNTFFKNDTALNGRYYFSPSAKYKHWPDDLHYHYVKQDGFFWGASRGSFRTQDYGLNEGLWKGNFVDGKKEGLWVNAKASSYPKKTPADPVAYFFSHPKQCFDLQETFYKNGMKDGLHIEYSKYNPQYDDEHSKKPSYLYKEMECSYTRDTLNGLYQEYYHNQRLKKDLHFVMGSPDGAYKHFLENGELYKLTHFNKGKLEGPYMAYNDGKISCYANFKNNRLVDSLVYYSKGVRGIALYFRNDTLLKRVCYYPDGKTKELVEFSDRSAYSITEHSISEDNYIETIKESGEETMRNIQAHYRNYYDNGQLLSEGEVRDGELYGLWKFHAINGIVVHEVNFADTLIHLPNDTALTEIAGFYKGYYTTGAKRCTGYIKDLELSYDCFTKQDKPMLDFYPVDFFDINGKALLKNGKGYFISYDANGLRVSAGKVIHCREDSLWKYYTPEQKLEETGNYVNHKKDGVWYEGSLEGINFEDGACFDMNNTAELKAFENERKKLSISRITYKNGIRIETVHFDSDLNKTHDPSRNFD